MRESSSILSWLVLAGVAFSAQADSILWVSDNGAKGTEAGSDGVNRGVFHPAVSGETPYVDQGFVNLLTQAGHRVTRFNPNSTSMSIDDVPLINGYDLIILGAALNSGPFNLNSRGAKWNTMITPPMIITKSTLIRRDRMGYLLDNKEFDCAADASTTASGKFTFVQPNHPIFDGIARTIQGGNAVMSNFGLTHVPSPVNNRAASVQYFKLSIGGVDQGIANAVEPGGVVLATIDFNPLDPGVNIPSGQTPAVDGTYQATGYAIVEWPTGTSVRNSQVAGETNASYRLLFACGTRDATGSVTAAPNPEVGALNLTTDGQRLFLNAVRHALSKGPRRLLSSTWGEWDYKQYLYGGTGNLVLTDQTAGGFTAWVATNDVDVFNTAGASIGSDGAIEPAGRPTIYQEFAPLDLSEIGQKVTATFDLKFNNALNPSDQFVRFGFGNPNNNSSFYMKVDSGLGGGTTLGWRSDASITDTNGTTLISPTFNPAGNLATAVLLNVPVKGPHEGFVPGNYSHFMNSGSLPGAAYPGGIGAYPNGVGLGVEDTLNVIHTFTMSMERVEGGLKIGATWSNSAGPEVLESSYSTPYNDQPLADGGHGKLDQIGCLGFNLMNNDLFNLGAAGGTYRVSNMTLAYVTPPVLRLTGITHEAGTDQFSLSWVSEPDALYTLESTTDWSGWATVQAGIASEGESTTKTLNSTAPAAFYRIRKQ